MSIDNNVEYKYKMKTLIHKDTVLGIKFILRNSWRNSHWSERTVHCYPINETLYKRPNYGNVIHNKGGQDYGLLGDFSVCS
jgi:hypothetical protein